MPVSQPEELYYLLQDHPQEHVQTKGELNLQQLPRERAWSKHLHRGEKDLQVKEVQVGKEDEKEAGNNEFRK